MPIYMQYESLTKVGAGTLELNFQGNPNDVFRKIGLEVASHSIRKVVFEWSALPRITDFGPSVSQIVGGSLADGSYSGHTLTSHEASVLGILIALLLPFLTPRAEIGFAGFQIDQAQLDRFSTLAGRPLGYTGTTTVNEGSLT